MDEKNQSKKQKAMEKGKFDGHSFKPDINGKSSQIAVALREQAEDSRVVEDRLISFKDQYYKQRTDKAIEKDMEDSRMHSFQPSIIQSNMVPRAADKNKPEMSKWDELHRQSVLKYGRRDMPEDEIAFNKEKREYTFQPNSHKYGGASGNRSANRTPAVRSPLNRSIDRSVNHSGVMHQY